MRIQTGAVVALMSLCAIAGADVITANGDVHEGVIVREGANRYYVQFPSDGSMRSFSKTDVDPASVVLSEREERAELKARWQAQKEDAAEVAVTQPDDRGNDRGDAGKHGVSRRDGKVMIRVHGEDGDRQRMAFRIYQMNNAGETLPKIVVTNPGGSRANDAVSFSSITDLFGGSGGVTGFGGGYGGGNFGGGGGNFGGGGGNFGGGGGGFGGGGGGFGGGGGGGGQQGAFFTNISQLFGTISDLQVGETPAIIGLSGGVR